jgi:hypothetical protein
MIRTSSLVVALLLGSGVAAAQTSPPAPGINRNPAYREQLPPNPVPPPDVRDTVVPNPGPGDPRDSDTRPVQPVASPAAPASAPASTGPTTPARQPADATRR